MMKYFDDPVYGFRFFLFDRRQYKRYCPDLSKELSENCVAQTIYDSKGNDKLQVHTLTAIHFTKIFYQKDSYRQQAVIAHECWHLLEQCLFNIGVGINLGEYNEHIAYYLTFLVENYTRLLNENSM